MIMNKQSNTYTILYIIIMVLVVGAALALTAMALKPRQQANSDADKMRQILAAVHIVPEQSEIIPTFDKVVTRQFIVNDKGDEVNGNAFDVNVALQSKKDASSRLLPVYVATVADGSLKYILPVYGAGLWGPIWGYVAIDADGSTVYGAYFAHQGETPGLGAEIEKPKFSDQFDGKQMFKNGKYLPVTVVKAGQKPADGEDYVDAVSGGTITSKGVAAMLSDCLLPYETFLENLRKQ